MQDVGKKHYIVIDVVPPTVKRDEAEEQLDEMLSLIGTYGGGKVMQIIQRRENPHPGTYIGEGKAEEVGRLIDRLHIDVVIINGIASATQLYKLLKRYWPINPDIEVWDRVDLILHIFEKHARTAESKLQIKLAKMHHMGPRMYGLSEELGRQGGGIGTRGAGETNVELMKRHWRDAIKETRDKLTELQGHRIRQLERRRKIGFRTVSIVGYTNAGKTTLFNLLTKKHKLAKDVLFATLDSTIGKLFIPTTRAEVMISDTIGFIKNLPPSLIDAFKSTLLESVHADLLLHVVDASDPKLFEKITVVEEILRDLKIESKTSLLVLNKSDRMTAEDKNNLAENLNHPGNLWISAHTGEGIEELKERIGEMVRY